MDPKQPENFEEAHNLTQIRQIGCFILAKAVTDALSSMELARMGSGGGERKLFLTVSGGAEGEEEHVQEV